MKWCDSSGRDTRFPMVLLWSRDIHNQQNQTPCRILLWFLWSFAIRKKYKYSLSSSLLFLSISFHVQISNYCFFFCLIPAYHFLFNLSSIIPIHFISYAVAYAAMSSRRPRAAARNLSRATTLIQVRGVPVSIVQGGGTAINFQLSPSRLGRCVVCYCYQWTNYSLLLRLHHAQLHDVERRPKGKSLVPVHGHD